MTLGDGQENKTTVTLGDGQDGSGVERLSFSPDRTQYRGQIPMRQRDLDKAPQWLN